MSRLVHLNALHALEAALRLGTLRKAAAELGVSQAALGQRIRALEQYLDQNLLQRGPNGVMPTALAEAVQSDLAAAFALLESVAEGVNLDRDRKLRLTVDADFQALWLQPRLAGFHATHPGVLVELAGDTPSSRPSDIEVFWGTDASCPVLWPDVLIPVLTDEILRLANANDRSIALEGIPLLHVADRPGAEKAGWPEWLARYGMRNSGLSSGMKLASLAAALSAARQGAGVLLAPERMVRDDLERGTLRPLFEPNLSLATANAYRFRIPPRAADRRPVRQFRDWLVTNGADFAGS